MRYRLLVAVATLLAIIACDVALARFSGAANDAEASLTGSLALLALVLAVIFTAIGHLSCVSEPSSGADVLGVILTLFNDPSRSHRGGAHSIFFGFVGFGRAERGVRMAGDPAFCRFDLLGRRCLTRLGDFDDSLAVAAEANIAGTPTRYTYINVSGSLALGAGRHLLHPGVLSLTMSTSYTRRSHYVNTRG